MDKQLNSAVLNELCRLNSLYQRMMSPTELAAAAEMFAKALEGERLETIGRAFALHMKHGRRFPTPGDITALLPEARQPCPSKPMRGLRTRGYGQLICALYKRRLPCMEIGLGRKVLERMAKDGVDPETCPGETWDTYLEVRA